MVDFYGYKKTGSLIARNIASSHYDSGSQFKCMAILWQ